MRMMNTLAQQAQAQRRGGGRQVEAERGRKAVQVVQAYANRNRKNVKCALG